jgi:hypothetical protein
VIVPKQERRRAGQVNSHAEDAEAGQPGERCRKPHWAKIREAFDRVPQEEMEELPTDGAAKVENPWCKYQSDKKSYKIGYGLHPMASR